MKGHSNQFEYPRAIPPFTRHATPAIWRGTGTNPGRPSRLWYSSCASVLSVVANRPAFAAVPRAGLVRRFRGPKSSAHRIDWFPTPL